MTNGDDSQYVGSDNPVAVSSDVQSSSGAPVPVASTQTTQPTQTTSSTGSDTSDTGDSVVQEAVKAYDADRARETEAQKYYDQIRSQIDDVNQRIQAMPSPTPPEHMAIPTPPDQQRQQNGTIGTMLAQGIMIAGIASVVFGRRHNPWATAAITSGMGSFINGYTKAQHDLATEQMQNWNKSVEYAVKMNQEADRTYNEILANKRLDLTQQMDLIKTIAAQRQDVEMYKAATTKDLNQIIRVVEQHEKANSAMSRAQIDVNSRAANIWLKSKVGNAWSMYVMDQSKKDGDFIDPTANDGGASFRKARDKYPPSQWMDSHTTSGAAKKAAGATVSYASLAKEATSTLGKDQGSAWTKVLQNDEPFERGDVVDKTEEHPGLLGTPLFGSAPTKVKVWKPDPEGTKYTFGEDDDEKLKNAQPKNVIDSLAAKYDKLKQAAGGEAKSADTDKYPTLTTQTAQQYPAGTVFKDPAGNIRRIISQSPLQVTPPLSESDLGNE